MRPVENTITETGALPGREVAFKIGNPIWVMKNLAKLYSDTTTAVIREYSTNAYDAHVMSGKQNVPIKVTLPSLYNPYFTVEDFGIGMSEVDLDEVYTSFGDSTKRESNDTNGMYGFGSKSAVAYTTQFTIRARKDGFETHAVVSKKPDYSMTMTFVSSKPTDSPDGTQIIIPVHNIDEFCLKARNFYRFWHPGTVEINGTQPEQEVGDKLSDNLYMSPKPGISYVVMGNVGYRIANPDALFRNAKMKKISFVAYVPGGSVEHTPSREDLEYTELTKQTLHKVIEDVETKILIEARKQIETAATVQEAWKLWSDWGQRIGHSLFHGMEWRGKKFVHTFDFKDAVRYSVPSRNGHNARYNTYTISDWEVAQSDNTLFVTEFQADRADGIGISVEASHKKKAREYFEHVGKDIKYVIFSKKAPKCDWISQDNVITWEDLKAAVPKKIRVAGPPRSKRPKGLFDFYTVEGKKFETLIPDDADLFYITAGDAKKYSVVDALKVMKADKTITVVTLAVNRVEKFKRDNFAVREFVEWAKKKVIIKSETLLDDNSKIALNLTERTIVWLKALDYTKINDPKWKIVTELLEHRKYTAKYEENIELARCLGMGYDIIPYRLKRTDDSLIDQYPLLDRLNHWQMEPKHKAEIITYINASYEAQKGKP